MPDWLNLQLKNCLDRLSRLREEQSSLEESIDDTPSAGLPAFYSAIAQCKTDQKHELERIAELEKQINQK
jgi:hypothetical protein